MHLNRGLEKFVNLPELLVRVEGDSELLEELFALFRGEFPPNFEAMHSAIGSCDLVEIEKLAHTLKGMLVNLSIERAASLAGEVESKARSGDVLKTGESFTALEMEIKALFSALNACWQEESK